jgi:hypothetical protein
MFVCLCLYCAEQFSFFRVGNEVCMEGIFLLRVSLMKMILLTQITHHGLTVRITKFLYLWCKESVELLLRQSFVDFNVICENFH